MVLNLCVDMDFFQEVVSPAEPGQFIQSSNFPWQMNAQSLFFFSSKINIFEVRTDQLHRKTNYL